MHAQIEKQKTLPVSIFSGIGADRMSERFYGTKAAKRKQYDTALSTQVPGYLHGSPAHNFGQIPIYAKPAITLQPKLTINTSGDSYEQEADRVAEQVMQMPAPALQRKCACGGTCSNCQKKHTENKHLQTKSFSSNEFEQPTVPDAVHDVLRAPGQPLDTATRVFMESRFGHDFRNVRVHDDAKGGASAKAINAHAYTVGNHIVFGEHIAPGAPAFQHLLAHELTHVVQQSESNSRSPAADAESEHEAETIAQDVTIGNTPSKVSRHSPQRIARAPNKTGLPANKPAVPTQYTYTETKLPGGRVQLRAYGTVGDPIARPGLELKYPLPSKASLPGYDRWHLVGPDAMGAEAGIAYAPKNFNVSKTATIENVVRNARDYARANGGEVYFDFTAECRVAGDVEGVEIRVLEKVTWKVGSRPAGSDKVIPLVNETASPQVSATISGSAASAEKPALTTKKPAVTEKPPVAVEKPPVPMEKPPAPTAERPPVAPEGEPAAVPKGGGKGSGIVGGVLSVAIPLVAGWVHQKAVENRIKEQAKKEGYVPRDAPSGQGFFYDLGSWLIDPGRDAEKAVSIDKRLDIAVWRARLRGIAASKKPGETFKMTWDVGKCNFDVLGNQEMESREITYRKEDNGQWVIQSGKDTDIPDLNSILSPDVSDSTIKAIIMNDPCSA